MPTVRRAMEGRSSRFLSTKRLTFIETLKSLAPIVLDRYLSGLQVPRCWTPCPQRSDSYTDIERELTGGTGEGSIFPIETGSPGFAVLTRGNSTL